MVILDSTKLTANPLESFSQVFCRQQPVVFGEPIPMKQFKNEMPRSVGNPWRGAYSRNGTWYKFVYGDVKDYNAILALATEQSQLAVQYGALQYLKNSTLIVAKAQCGDVLGSIAITSFDDCSVIGFHFVCEDARHSGIGEKLFNEAQTLCPSEKNVVFNAIHPLHHSLSNFRLSLQKNTQPIFKLTLKKPTGFKCLRELAYEAIEIKALTPELLLHIDARLAQQHPNTRKMSTLSPVDGTFGHTLWKNGEVISACIVREITSNDNECPDLVIGPWFAKDSESAETVLKIALQKFYNPEDDHFFDPNPLEIHQRTLHLFIPLEIIPKTKTILAKFCGENGTLSTHRLWYQCSSMQPIKNPDYSTIWAAGDLHHGLI